MAFLAAVPGPVQSLSRRPLQADYVVIGLGTAGGAAAHILSSDKKTSVIALHNGEDLTQDPLIKYSQNAPITVISALIGPPLYENGTTTPQPNADDRELPWALALPEGGASSVNAGAYCRGTDQLYAQWEEIAGPRWSVPRITAVYKQLENYHGETSNPASRGYCGPLDIRHRQVSLLSWTIMTPSLLSEPLPNFSIRKRGKKGSCASAAPPHSLALM
jgi:choline dehydrogenase-like flavoprotein